MLLTQQTFYRKFGVRLLTQLPAPAMHELKLLEFPRESIYHYLSYDTVSDGPANDDPLLRNARRPVPTLTPTQLSHAYGDPIRLGGDGQALVREYFKTHRRMHRALNVNEAVKDRETPLLVNYAILNSLYRYPNTVFSPYNHWRNLFATFITTASSLANDLPRHHYVFLNVPKVLPSLMQLQHAAKQMDAQAIKAIREPAGYVLLELWKWFLPNENGDPSLLRNWPKEKLHLLNFVFVEGGKWCLLNMGVLNSFFLPDGQKQPDHEYVIQAKQHVGGMQMAKRVLRMYMSIMEARNSALKALLAQQLPPTDDQTKQQVQPTVVASTQLDHPTETTSVDKLAPDNMLAQANYLPGVSIIDEQEIEQLGPEHFAQLIQEQDAEISHDLAQLEQISQTQLQESAHPSWMELARPGEIAPAESGVVQLCERLAASGSISAAEYRRHVKAAQSYKTIKAPVGDESLEKFLPVDPEVLKIDEQKDGLLPADDDSVIDKTMLKSSLAVMTSRYVNQVLHKDIAGAVMGMQNAGVAVTGYRVEKTQDILGGYETHVVKLQPVIGQPSTLRFKVPIVNEDGTYMSQGTRYSLRPQRGDLPIRKTAPNKVALTSYYGKCFITRGRVNSSNWGYWLKGAALSKALNKNDSHLSDAVVKNVFDPNPKHTLPRNYTSVAHSLQSVTVMGRYALRFDYAQALLDELITSAPESHPFYLGKDLQTGSKLWINSQGEVAEDLNGSIGSLGRLEELMGIDGSNQPLEYTTARVFGKDIPVGVMLGLTMGMERLLAALRVQPRIVPAGQRANITSQEWGLRFSDETWVFDRSNQMASLILGGFLEYEKTLRAFSAHSFEKRGAYVNLLEINGLGVRYVREMDMMNNMFVDSITRDILVGMKEPTTLTGLLLRANELLLTDQHPDELDPLFMRDKGYERVAGAIYTELVHALRQHNSSLSKSHLGVQLNPYAVWKRLSEDSSKLQVSEINPIAALKDQEAVTFLGDGGRSRRSMTKRTRGYHRNAMGVDSEATVDNSDVAINIYTSADPQYTSLRGLRKPFDLSKPNATAILSTSALLAPGSDRDDPKRVNFVSIQQKHAIACVGYHQPIVRTGYETVVPHRTTDLYAFTAKQPGKVRSVTERGVIVDYADGSSQGYEVGRRFGNSQGLTVAHEVVTPLKPGDELVLGDVIVYNTGFFEPDFFNPKRVVWKNSMYARTVLWESALTYEDSSMLSQKTAQSLTSKITKVKLVVLRFDQAISHMVKPGDRVEAESVLCIIQDEVTANNKLFNEQSIQTLKALSAQTPRAHVSGLVEKIEVFYHGDREDMSESIAQLCDWGDENRKEYYKSLGKKPLTGAVDSGFRIDSDSLGLDQVAVRFYITYDAGFTSGDKGVFGNQLKTVVGEVMEKPLYSQDGEEIDAVFGYRSVEARIVDSATIVGTTATLMIALGKHAAQIYRGTKKPS